MAGSGIDRGTRKVVPTFQNKGDHLFVEVSGPYSMDLFLTTIDEVADRCQQEKLDKVLVDLRKVSGNPGILGQYQWGVKIAEVWRARLQAASVAKRKVVNFFGETMAVNRGANFKAFSDIRKARKWLGVKE